MTSIDIFIKLVAFFLQRDLMYNFSQHILSVLIVLGHLHVLQYSKGNHLIKNCLPVSQRQKNVLFRKCGAAISVVLWDSGSTSYIPERVQKKTLQHQNVRQTLTVLCFNCSKINIIQVYITIHGCLKRLFIDFFDKKVVFYITKHWKPSANNVELSRFQSILKLLFSLKSFKAVYW